MTAYLCGLLVACIPLSALSGSGGPDTTGATPLRTTLRVGDAPKVGQRIYLRSLAPPAGAHVHEGRDAAIPVFRRDVLPR